MCNKIAVRLTFLILTILPSVHGAEIAWTNIAGGNWTNAANWNPNQVPGTNDTAWITNDGTYIVTLTTNASVASIHLGSFGSGIQSLYQLGGSNTLIGASTGSVNGVFLLGGGSLTGTGSFDMAGQFVWTNGTCGGLDQNHSSTTLVIVRGGLNLVSFGFGQRQLVGGALVNAGNCVFTNANATAFSMFNSPIFSNLVGATFEFQSDGNPSIQRSGSPLIVNEGTFLKTAGGSAFGTTINPTFRNSGTFEVRTGLAVFASSQNPQFLQTGGLTKLDGGRLSTGGGNNVLFFQGGILAGTNSIGCSALTNSALFSPGLDSSPGLLSITTVSGSGGNFTQTASGQLAIKLAGTTPGTGYDQLGVTGVANLSGTLNVSLTNGFLPTNGATFLVLTNGSRTGTFNQFNFPSTLVTMALSYESTGVVVHVTGVNSPLLRAFQTPTNSVVVAWPAPSTGFGLQQNSNLTSINWTSVTNATNVVNGENQVIISPPAGNRFYRLIK
jgi:hypothetical protein